MEYTLLPVELIALITRDLPQARFLCKEFWTNSVIEKLFRIPHISWASSMLLSSLTRLAIETWDQVTASAVRNHAPKLYHLEFTRIDTRELSSLDCITSLKLTSVSFTEICQYFPNVLCLTAVAFVSPGCLNLDESRLGAIAQLQHVYITTITEAIRFLPHLATSNAELQSLTLSKEFADVEKDEEYLVVSVGDIDDDLPFELLAALNLQSLTSLTFRYGRSKPDFFDRLSSVVLVRCPKLQRFVCGQNLQCKEMQIPELLQSACPSLQSIRLSLSVYFPTGLFLSLSLKSTVDQHLQGCEELTLDQNGKHDDQAWWTISRGFSSSSLVNTVTYLDLHCTLRNSLTDEAVLSLIWSCRVLEELKLAAASIATKAPPTDTKLRGICSARKIEFQSRSHRGYGVLAILLMNAPNLETLFDTTFDYSSSFRIEQANCPRLRRIVRYDVFHDPLAIADLLASPSLRILRSLCLDTQVGIVGECTKNRLRSIIIGNDSERNRKPLAVGLNLESFSNLEKLVFRYLSFTRANVLDLSVLTSLTSLTFDSCQFDDECASEMYEWMCSLPYLKLVYVGGRGRPPWAWKRQTPKFLFLSR